MEREQITGTCFGSRLGALARRPLDNCGTRRPSGIGRCHTVRLSVYRHSYVAGSVSYKGHIRHLYRM